MSKQTNADKPTPEQFWADEDLDKYDFVVKPGSLDYDERVLAFTLEENIQQSKAFRAWEWDRYGTTGELDARYFEMEDADIADMEKELRDRDFNRDFDQLSDEDVLYTARTWLINLTANGNEDARNMGITEEQIDELRAKIAAMEKAVEAEKKEIRAREQGRINKASADLLNKLGPSSNPIIIPFKPPTGGQSN